MPWTTTSSPVPSTSSSSRPARVMCAPRWLPPTPRRCFLFKAPHQFRVAAPVPATGQQHCELAVCARRVLPCVRVQWRRFLVSACVFTRRNRQAIGFERNHPVCPSNRRQYACAFSRKLPRNQRPIRVSPHLNADELHTVGFLAVAEVELYRHPHHCGAIRAFTGAQEGQRGNVEHDRGGGRVPRQADYWHLTKAAERNRASGLDGQPPEQQLTPRFQHLPHHVVVARRHPA